MKRLNESFVDFEVLPSGIAGNEKTMVEYCHDFCLEHVTNFDRSWMYEAMIETLSGSYSGDLSYFAYEQLPNFMNTIAPVGTVFRSHEGDSSMGFWAIVDFDYYDDFNQLPYKLSGHKVYPYNTPKITDRLNKVDDFLSYYEENEYDHSDLQYAIQDIASMDHDDLINDEALHAWAIILLDKTIELIQDQMLPERCVWRVENGQVGIFDELPGYSVVAGSSEEIETTDLIMTSSIWAKLVYVIENRESEQLRNCPVNGLNDVCLSILYSTHFVPFYETLELSAIYNRRDMAQYIGEDYNAMTYVIEKYFFNDFKCQIDRITGNQDITRLWQSILAQENIIDGINRYEDVWSLRESCKVCEDIEYFDSAEWSNKNCICCDYSALNNVWIIGEYEFYQKLSSHGAMVYETNSLYLYLQTDHAGNYYDNLLRKAWLSYCATAYMGDLTRQTQIDS